MTIHLRYADEFGDAFTVPQPLLDYFAQQSGWEDTSWGNDECPSFTNKDLRLQLFVDSEYTNRDYPTTQFTLVGLNKNGEHTRAILNIDNLEDVLSYLHTHKALFGLRHVC